MALGYGLASLYWSESMPEKDYKGHIMTKPLCIVIGVGPGNGASFARRFSSDAHHVAILARNANYLNSLAKSIPECDAFPCDVQKPEALRKTLAEVAERLGPASVMIYNAGAGEWRPPEETTLEGFAVAPLRPLLLQRKRPSEALHNHWPGDSRPRAYM